MKQFLFYPEVNTQATKKAWSSWNNVPKPAANNMKLFCSESRLQLSLRLSLPRSSQPPSSASPTELE